MTEHPTDHVHNAEMRKSVPCQLATRLRGVHGVWIIGQQLGDVAATAMVCEDVPADIR